LTSISPFDRLAGARRNKKYRNITMTVGISSGFLAVLFALDPLMSGQPMLIAPFLGLTLVCFVALGLALYFHLKFVSRD
jgi:hypothetical protein